MNIEHVTAESLQVSNDVAARLLKGVERTLNKMASVLPDFPSFDESSFEDVVCWAVKEHLQDQGIFNNAILKKRTAEALKRFDAVSVSIKS